MTAPYDSNATMQVLEQGCSNRSWLSISPTGSFVAGNGVQLRGFGESGGDLPGSTCNGTVSTVSASGVRTTTVTLTVAPATTTKLSANVGSLSFTGIVNGAPPAAQTLSITSPAVTSATVQATEQTCTGQLAALTPGGTFTAGPTKKDFQVRWIKPDRRRARYAPAHSMTSPSARKAGGDAGREHGLGGTACGHGDTHLPLVHLCRGGFDPGRADRLDHGCGGVRTFRGGDGEYRLAASFSVVPGDRALRDADQRLVQPGGHGGSQRGERGRRRTWEPITVAGIGKATGTTNINVSLTVTAPIPSMSLITNGASFVTGPVAAGEIISIFGNAGAAIGPPTAVSLERSQLPGAMHRCSHLDGRRAGDLPAGRDRCPADLCEQYADQLPWCRMKCWAARRGRCR